MVFKLLTWKNLRGINNDRHTGLTMSLNNELSTLVDTLKYNAQENANRIAIICGNEEVSYAHMAISAKQLASNLTENNIQSGDRVAYFGKESLHFYYLLFACALTGVVLVPVNWRLTEQEVGHILQDSDTKGLFFDCVHYDMTVSLQENHSQLDILISLDSELSGCEFIGQWYQSQYDNFVEANVNEDTVIAQLYTSGTTGLPKGVELAHRSFFKVMASLKASNLNWVDWQPDDVSLSCVPSFHIGGLWYTIQGLNVGAMNVLIRNFIPSVVLEIIAEKQVSIICMVPSMILLLLFENNVDDYKYDHLRKIVYGGSPIGEKLLVNAMEQFQCDFAQIYGLTETGNTAVCLTPEVHVIGSEKLKAAGKPYPCVALKIIDLQGNELADGEVGEICIKSPAAMLGYWQLPEATSTTLVNGWVHSGDAGYIKDGYLYICDRIKDMIIVAGENVYPSEIENVLAKCPGVKDVAVIGVPHEHWGEAIQAIIVRDDDKSEVITPRGLVVFAKSQLADFKIPHHFEFTDKIPRNPSGKILRRSLLPSQP